MLITAIQQLTHACAHYHMKYLCNMLAKLAFVCLVPQWNLLTPTLLHNVKIALHFITFTYLLPFNRQSHINELLTKCNISLCLINYHYAHVKVKTEDSEEEFLPPLGAHCVVTSSFFCFHKELFLIVFTWKTWDVSNLTYVSLGAHVHLFCLRNVPAPNATKWRCCDQDFPACSVPEW